MAGIRKSLLQFIFSGTSMRRWNDKLRPMELVEVDKQAHKMITAWCLMELNSRDMKLKQRVRLADDVIFGGIADYLYRLVITDIKPPIFYKIKDNPEHYHRLTDWVLDQLYPLVQPLGNTFWSRLQDYFKSTNQGLAENILQAAHMYASRWEFSLLKDLNSGDEETEEIEKSFAVAVQDKQNLHGMHEISCGQNNPLGRFTHLCGQLRFQKRWSQTPRIPETSVLGHMFLVACYVWLMSLTLGTCRAGRCNNFFAGLFHDVPELLTRDIISPVKSSSRELGELVREYEAQELEEKILSPLRQAGYNGLVAEIEYFLGLDIESEFDCSILVNHQAVRVSRQDLAVKYNQDHYNPKDGYLLRVCDHLAAFIEAYSATKNGINNDQLHQAQWRIREKYRNLALSENVHIGALLADFD